MSHSSKLGTDTQNHPTKVVCARFGITPRTIDRWLRNQALDFPRPLVVNRRRYFNEAHLRDWERRQLEKQLSRPTLSDGGRR